MTKTCSNCNTEKDLSEFRPHVLHKHGVASYCKICSRLKNNERYHRVLKGDPSYKARIRSYAKDWHQQNKERNNSRVSVNHRTEREECLKHYGGVCACCGEGRYEFLSIDHIHGGGGKHRKVIGQKMSRWLTKQGFPSGFRILCHNCNQALGHYGYCPHGNALAKGA